MWPRFTLSDTFFKKFQPTFSSQEISCEAKNSSSKNERVDETYTPGSTCPRAKEQSSSRDIVATPGYRGSEPSLLSQLYAIIITMELQVTTTVREGSGTPEQQPRE